MPSSWQKEKTGTAARLLEQNSPADRPFPISTLQCITTLREGRSAESPMSNNGTLGQSLSTLSTRPAYGTVAGGDAQW